MVQSTILAGETIVNGSPFPDPGNDFAVSQSFQRLHPFVVHKKDSEWTKRADHIRENILKHRPYAAVEMLVPLTFLTGDGLRFHKTWRDEGGRYRFFTTTTNLMGMGPDETQPGDMVTALAGIAVPMVLRPVKCVPVKYTVVGPCYVNGIMNGEAIADMQECGGLAYWEKRFVLV